MIYLSNTILGIVNLLDWTLQIYLLIVVASVILSWVEPNPYNPIVQFLRAVTEPTFRFIRDKIKFTEFGVVDLSPFFLMIFIYLTQILILGNLKIFALNIAQ
jgi:YggT family protein